MATEAVIPLFPCKSLVDSLDFYRALGFEVTSEQTEPYPYGSVQRGGVEIHFTPRLSVHGAKNAFGASLVLVDDLQVVYRVFAERLRAKYGRIPTAGLPRITRPHKGQTRFTTFDPSGNLLIYIERNEPEASYYAPAGEQSELGQALENAVFLRDTYSNDIAAAKVLDSALQKHDKAGSVERARALAARAELAVALGEGDRARALLGELDRIPLSDDDRERFREELRAADELDRWLTGK